jgi:hypothetical protein
MATAYELWTYEDAVQHVLDVCSGNDPSLRNARLARRAVVECYRDFPTLREWRYFQPRLNITTVASQSTGTIAYTHSTRQVTLTGATWPSDVLDYVLVIGQVRCVPTVRDSSTVITLSEAQNPGADVAAEATYELYKDTYALPDNFVAATGILRDVLDPYRMVREQTLAEIVSYNRLLSSGLPDRYTFVKHPRYAGGMAILFSPAPNEAKTYELPCVTRPRPLRTKLYTTGTVTTTADSTAATGTGTAFASAHAGCVLRVSENSTTLPTTVIGSMEDLNPAALTRLIKSVTNATTLVLEQAADVSLAGMKYTISDPIDFEHGAMLTAFLRMAEYRFDLLAGKKESLSIRKATFERALDDAGCADSRGYRPQEPEREYLGLPSITSSTEQWPE